MRAFRFAAVLLMAPMTLAPFAGAKAQVGIGIGVAITVAPPMLPEYDQPPMPEPGYMWTPGYWAWGDGDYYWVPGTWVQPPTFGMYWTPGYWAWRDGAYVFIAGYWGPEVGYYGGIDYGYGYGGFGYQGGEWHGRDFSYNRSANNFGHVHVDNAYDRPIAAHPSGGERASFNGPRGATARPTPQEEAAGRLGHMQPTAQQTQHIQAAAQDRTLRASVNGGRPAPAAAATERPRQINGAAAPGPAIAPQRQGAVPLPQRETAPQAQHEAAPQQHQGVVPQPQREAAPQPQHEAAPQPRQNVVPQPQHEAVPERQAAPQPQREAAPPRPAAPQPQHEAAPPPRPAAPQPQHEVAPPPRQAPPQPQREAAPPRPAAPQAAPAPHPAAPAKPDEEHH